MHWLRLALAAGLLLGVVAVVRAAAPEAGTIIQNQAAASYEPCLDATCAAASSEEVVTSNLVETLIQQVAALALTNDQTRPISPGGLAFLPHQLVNLGNGPDDYQLCIENVGTDIGTWQVFVDADRDGLPDSATPLFDDSDPDGCADAQTPSLAPGATYDFVIEVAVPAATTPGVRPTLDVTATSTFDPTASARNTDTLEVVAGPVIEIIKRIDPVSGPSPQTGVQITLEYRNTGLADATALVVEDVLPLLTESGAVGAMRLVAGSARWSETGSTVLTDADDGDQGTGPDLIDFCGYDALGTCDDRIRFTLASVPAGASGSVTFEVDIDAGIEDDERLLNEVTFAYEDAGGTNQFGTPTPFRSNTVAYRVVAEARNPAVVANDSRSDAITGTDDASDVGNVVTVASVEQGERPQFEVVIWNAGDGSDVFDLVVDAQDDRLGSNLTNPFPAGTLFRVLRSDGVTPLADTDASGTVDTGTLPVPGAAGCGSDLLLDAVAERCGLPVIVEVVLAASAMASDVPGGGFEATLRANSGVDAAVDNAASVRLLAISDSAVDLTNDVAVNGGAPGEGAGPEAEPVTTRIGESGQAVLFTLVINNTGSVSDAFEIVASDDLDFFNATFAASPSYGLEFLADAGAGDCSSTAGSLSQTGPLAPGASRTVCARVDIPADAPGGETVDIYFRVRSATTGASDVKLDRVVVVAGPAIDVINDENGQTEPGSSITYSHLVTNVGNVDLENVVFSALPLLENDNGWSVVLYLDQDDDGERTPADPFIEPGLPVTGGPFDLFEVGEQVRFFAVVFAPASAAFGEQNSKTITVTADPVGGGASVSDAISDLTTASASDMTVLKEQALDADCDGAADGPDACTGDACFRTTTFQVVPGEQCIVYRLTATNTGSQALFNVRILDTTQPFTSYLAAAQRCEEPSGNCDADVTAPAEGGTGDVEADIGELAAGEQAQLYFGLRVE